MNEFERLRRNILINQGGEIIPSYLVKTDDSIIYFELNNTPIANFATTGLGSASITVNSQSVVKNTIKEIKFGTSYRSVTNTGNYFLYSCTSLTSIDLSVFSNLTSIGSSFLSDCTSLTSIDLSVFSNLTSIGNSFLIRCTSLTSIDLSVFSNLTSIGNSFLQGCSGLTSIDLSSLSNLTSIGTLFLAACSSLTLMQVGGVDWSVKTVNTNGFYSVTNVYTRALYANTSQLAANFKAKFPNISNWTVVVN